MNIELISTNKSGQFVEVNLQIILWKIVTKPAVCEIVTLVDKTL